MTFLDVLCGVVAFYLMVRLPYCKSKGECFSTLVLSAVNGYFFINAIINAAQ